MSYAGGAAQFRNDDHGRPSPRGGQVEPAAEERHGVADGRRLAGVHEVVHSKSKRGVYRSKFTCRARSKTRTWSPTHHRKVAREEMKTVGKESAPRYSCLKVV